MTTGGLLIVGLVILVGLIGIVLPVLPGVILVLGAILVWAYLVGTTTAWATFGVAALVIMVTQVAKYVVPGRRLSASGVPNSTLLAGAVLGIVGFFVVPLVGLPIGFVLGVYAAEYLRLREYATAWSSTKVALRAVGLSLAIELFGALLASGAWLIVVLST